MEKNNNNGLIIFLVLIIALLSALCVLFATGTISLQMNNVDNKQSSDNSNNDAQNDIANNNANNKDEVIKKLKEALTDKNWIKENLYSKKNCFDQDVETEQDRDLKFEVLYDNDKNPIVIVSDYSIERFMAACYKVYYDNGVVSVKQIGYIGHPGHGGFSVDKGQGLVLYNYGHMGSYGFYAYDVKGSDITSYDEYTCDNCEYKYQGDKKYNDSDISDISIDLTDENINNYVK